ncbi:alpha-N-acetylgalactosaminide alpha-2,6-sialyltransferase 2 isoform X2 [Oryzias latipes]|uniref:alpha-N-acetylgalactosaminide alpha-2,6-sialyltransferase 2 isoform X2 n=1 Tax=Oryzias latipes TaxID=8090 RepID=UPI0005CC2DCF|nr:alpha-N-acetylgalactosaminide alpha-2,6-sialyltransferase 2 isoform X2 [Oryzias latipes]
MKKLLCFCHSSICFCSELREPDRVLLVFHVLPPDAPAGARRSSASTRSLLAMALLRRFFVAVGVVSFILCIYVLVLNRQWPPSASLMPHGYRQDVTRRTNSSEEPKEPPGRRDDPHRQPDLLSASPTKKPLPGHNVQTPAATEPHVHGKVRANVSTSPPGSDQVKKANESNRVLPTKPIGPTDPQYIGDSYMSDGVSLHTLCPDGVRARVQSSAFGSRFLERIPVLQTLKHATPEQYQRLRRYPGTHGWGGVDFKTLVETLSVLNTSANREMLDDWQRRGAASSCRRCAVVGNGGILKGSKKGKEIDHHHYIFRTNGAITKGFEEDVGSRTTHYTFSTNTLMNSMRSYARFGYSRPPVSEETRYVFLPDHDRDYLLAKAAATHTLVERGPERKQDPRKYFGEDVSAEKLKIYHPDFVRYLRNRFLRAGILKGRHRDIYRPSTGAVMLLAALHTCDQVSAYGFMTPDYKNYSDHYFDTTYRPVAFYANHDFRMEMDLWQELHKAGLIRLYMRH